jgi:hypothetical protein
MRCYRAEDGMNKSDYFPELNSKELERLISGHIKESTWLNDADIDNDERIRLKQVKIIDRIILYSGWEPGNPYAIVAVVNKDVEVSNSAEHRNYSYFLNWTSPSCMHIQDWLPRFYNKSYLPEDYFIQWSWINVKSKEELPVNFVYSDYHWILYDQNHEYLSGYELMKRWFSSIIRQSNQARKLDREIEKDELPFYKNRHKAAKSERYELGEFEFDLEADSQDRNHVINCQAFILTKYGLKSWQRISLGITGSIKKNR